MRVTGLAIFSLCISLQAANSEYSLDTRNPTQALNQISSSFVFIVVNSPGLQFSNICSLVMRAEGAEPPRIAAFVRRLSMLGLLGDSKSWRITPDGTAVAELINGYYIDGIEMWTLDNKSFSETVRIVFGADSRVTVSIGGC